MSTTTSTPFLAVNHLWTELSATITGIGIAAVALSPLLSGSPPTTGAGWIAEIAALAAAVLKAFGKS